jgi:SAM-dependent methyltransferase
MCVGSSEKFEVYERPEVYDFAFSRCLEAEVQFFEDLKQSYALPSESKVLDMGCGCGDWLVEMALAGHHCEGFDNCDSMVALARQKCSGYPITLYSDNLLQFDKSRTFDAVFCLCGTVHHLHGSGQLQRHFDCVSRCLLPNGLYLLDLHVSESVQPSDLLQHWVVENSESSLDVSFQYVTDGFDITNQRQWVELIVQGVFRGENIRLCNAHWFGAFTSERLLDAAKQACLRHLGWYSESPSVETRLLQPSGHASVYCLFGRSG